MNARKHKTPKYIGFYYVCPVCSYQLLRECGDEWTWLTKVDVLDKMWNHVNEISKIDARHKTFETRSHFVRSVRIGKSVYE